MLRNILLLALIVNLSFCSEKGTGKIEREGEPEVHEVQSEDIQMNEAVQKARITFQQFDEALKNNNPELNSFAIKTRYQTENGGEHVWLGDVSVKDGKYWGIVDNLPIGNLSIKEGDTVLVDTVNMSDWMYLEKGKLRGGYTIRVLRSRMSEEEQKQFDEAYGLIIEEESNE